jgi:hypothetical protein
MMMVSNKCQSLAQFLQLKLNQCMLLIPDWYSLCALLHFHGCNSENSSGKTIKPYIEVLKNPIEWV